MSVILDEYTQAEKIIETGDVGIKPTSTLFLLSKYYRQKYLLNKDETAIKLNEFMKDNYKNYNAALWEDIIDDISKKGIKYSLKKIPFIGITQMEIDTLNSVTGLKYQKLLFVILCHAKYHNTLSESNNDWSNIGIPEIYKLARVTVKHRNDKFLYLNDLEKNGYISFSNKNDNLNLRCNFVDKSDDYVLKIDDFRELGYEYLNFIGEGNFIRCNCCNKIVRKTNNKCLYCSDCAKKVKNEQNKVYYKNKI